MIPKTPTTLIIQHVRRGNHANVVQNPIARFLADENLNAIGAQAIVEQPQDVMLLVERLEQPFQTIDIGQLGESHKIRFTGNDIFHTLVRLAY